MPLRVDWDEIKSIGLDQSEPMLFVLPQGFRNIILSLSDRLSWRATFRTGGYDFGDWDDLQQIVSFGVSELLGGESVGEIVDAINALRQAVEDIQMSTALQVDCCADAYPAPTDDPGIVVGEGTPPATYGGQTVNDWADYTDLLCGAALLYASNLADSVRKIDDAVSDNLVAIGGIAVILSIFAALGLLMPISYGLAAGIFSALVGVAAGTVLDSAATALEDNQQEIANVIFCAGSASQARLDVETYLESILDATEWAILKFWDYENAMNVIYAGTDGDGNDVSVTPSQGCSCVAYQLTYTSAHPAYLQITQQAGDSFDASGTMAPSGSIDSRAWVGVDEGVDVAGCHAIEAVFDIDIDHENGWEWTFMQNYIRNINVTTPAVGESVLLHLAGYLGSTAGYDVVDQVGDLTLPAMTAQISTAIVALNRVSGSQPTPAVNMSMSALIFRDIDGNVITP